MGRCWGLTRNLNRCHREGPWWLFCGEHRRQWISWSAFIVFTVGGGTASILSYCAPPPSSLEARVDLLLRRIGAERAALGLRQDSLQSDAKRLSGNALGDPAEQFHLGTLFEEGVVLPKNIAEALKWYRLAARQGHRDAQARLNRLLTSIASTATSGDQILVTFYIVDESQNEVIMGFTGVSRAALMKQGGQAIAGIDATAPDRPGKYTLKACINPDNRIPERDYSNNCNTMQFNVE